MKRTEIEFGEYIIKASARRVSTFEADGLKIEFYDLDGVRIKEPYMSRLDWIELEEMIIVKLNEEAL